MTSNSTNILQVLNASTSRGGGGTLSPQSNPPQQGLPNNMMLLQQQQQLLNQQHQQLSSQVQLYNSLLNQQDINNLYQYQQQQQQQQTVVSPISQSSNGHSSNHSAGHSSGGSASHHSQLVNNSNQQQATPTSNTLMFINETTADVLNRGTIPTFDLNAPSTPTKKNNMNGHYSTPPNNYSNLNSPLLAHLKSPPSLKKHNSASTLHNTTSLRMKKHSGLGNFKANYFELEMKKKPKAGSKSNLDLSDANSLAQSMMNGMGPNGIPPNMSPRRGIEKSPSFSKKNSMLNLDRHSLAAALSQNNINIQPNQQLQEVGNKKFSLSFSETDMSVENQKFLMGIGNTLYSNQPINTSSGHTVLNPDVNQQLLYNRTAQQNGIMAQSTPELQNFHQQALFNSIFAAQSSEPGVFQQMSTTYPNSANQQVLNNNNNGQSDFDDMLDSLLNEDITSTGLSFDNVNNNPPLQSNAPSSPLSFFYKEDDKEQDQSLITDMDNFFLSGNDDQERNDDDQFLPLRPINPQEVMKEWENSSNNNSSNLQIDFEILNQF